MEKTYQVAEPMRTESPLPKVSTTTNWEICFICQTETTEALTCPARSKRQTISGYKTIAASLQGFEACGALPDTVQISRLDDGRGIETTLQDHEAKFHDSCRLKYNKTELGRAQKRKMQAPEPAELNTKRHSRLTLDTKQSLSCCFFCGKQGDLHEVTSLPLDKKIREHAFALQDSALLAKLSMGDLIALEAKYHKNCLSDLSN